MSKNKILKIKTAAAALVFCMILLLPLFINSSGSINAAQSTAAASAGSADDPLVTLSYITKALKPAEDKIKALEDKIAELENMLINQPAANQNTYIMSEGASSSYMNLELAKGQKLRAKSGSLEIVFRSGTASVVSEYQTQGIADITAGAELLNGADVPVNHYLIVPRSDGRGIEITSLIAYVMARGDYEIY